MNLFKKYTQLLSGIYSPREARNIMETLLMDSHGVSRTDLLLALDLNLDESKLEEQMKRLLNHEPVQYVTGIAHFYGHQFQVNRHVLIPRPETEELVEWVVSEHSDLGPVVWDIGTGSGCIALSISKEITNSKVYGIDISSEALKVAHANNERLKGEIDFILADILNEVPDLPAPDIIVSNPPYICESEKAGMSTNVLSFEPSEALFVSDDEPLIFYKKILDLAEKKMNANGAVYFEINEHLANDLIDYISSKGWKAILRKDLQGKVRMIRATKI